VVVGVSWGRWQTTAQCPSWGRWQTTAQCRRAIGNGTAASWDRASGNGCVVGSSITSWGQSGSWLQSKMNVCRIVNQFLLSTDERKKLAGLPQTFDSITNDDRPFIVLAETKPNQACNEKLYEEFAFYLANQYKCGAGKNKGEHLKVGPVVNYLNSLGLLIDSKNLFIGQYDKLFEEYWLSPISYLSPYRG
jgi:hypothetical protein